MTTTRAFTLSDKLLSTPLLVNTATVESLAGKKTRHRIYFFIPLLGL